MCMFPMLLISRQRSSISFSQKSDLKTCMTSHHSTNKNKGLGETFLGCSQGPLRRSNVKHHMEDVQNMWDLTLAGDKGCCHPSHISHIQIYSDENLYESSYFEQTFYQSTLYKAQHMPFQVVSHSRSHTIFSLIH